MTALTAVLALIAWSLGPIALTVALIILIIGLVTDGDEKPKLRKSRINLALTIGGISVAVMLGATILVLVAAAIGY